jgi:hypothetical protein
LYDPIVEENLDAASKDTSMVVNREAVKTAQRLAFRKGGSVIGGDWESYLARSEMASSE